MAGYQGTIQLAFAQHDDSHIDDETAALKKWLQGLKPD